ncbi:hypothetical protein [Kitasatospora purpeofusca]|nr:hypothetical protein [Kitasatospora purpeofusca]MDY0816816.1 hypothetical protein [Kitasatospora purpeofusca]
MTTKPFPPELRDRAAGHLPGLAWPRARTAPGPGAAPGCGA